ncbi:MAG: hypothetical protein COA32_03425 [Fluviicola sp.]|nr:MAG: hypothetical protein COA32_03425 [Fluviicola sp.]
MNMKKIVLLAFATVVSISSLFAQDENCYEKLENAFLERGAYTVSDDIHRNVIISFFEEDEVYCVKAKVRVENGFITSIFYYFDDNTSELYDKKFYNDKKQPPSIENGISEMITNVDGESFKVIFIEKLKPKKKNLKRVEIPDDL